MDKTEAELAASIGITEKTLRKHYSRLLKSRDIEKAMAETGITERMLELGMGGNASMMKLAIDRIERERLRKWESRQVLDDKTGEKLGKKEALNRDAKTPTGGWETILGDIPAQDEEKPN